MGQLLKGGSPHGSTENDPGTQGGNGGMPVPSESEVKMHSEKNSPGSPVDTGFNPTKK